MARQTVSHTALGAAVCRLIEQYQPAQTRLFTDPMVKGMMDTIAKDAPWVFGLEPSSIPVFLKPFHLALIADVANPDHQERYLKPLGRNLAVFGGERIAHAIVG